MAKTPNFKLAAGRQPTIAVVPFPNDSGTTTNISSAIACDPAVLSWKKKTSHDSAPS